MTEETEGNWDTTVITLENFTFEYLKSELKYSFPSNSSRRFFDYLAIYRVRPISAITHYAPIEEVIRDADVDGKYRLMAFGDKAPDEATQIVVREVNKLDHPVNAAEGQAIQGFYYTNLDYIYKANTIPELFSLRKK